MLEILPLLKWVGGKRQILGELISLMPSTYNTYCEPFLGGGALFFALHPSKAIVNDINEELINFYEVVRDDHQALLDIISEYQAKDCEEFFYEIRALDRDVENFKKTSKVVKAARTFYLNRTCFNGLYRVNSKGFFNSPYGKPIYKFIIDMIKEMEEQYKLLKDVTAYYEMTSQFDVPSLGDDDFEEIDPNSKFTQSPNMKPIFNKKKPFTLSAKTGHFNEDPLNNGGEVYRQVKGDFVVMATIDDVEGLKDHKITSYNDGGILVTDENGTYYQLGAFPLFNCGNMFTILSAEDRPQYPNYKGYELDRYLQFERRGNQLFARTSPDGKTWENMPGSPVEITVDTLSIGAYQSTYTDTPSWVRLRDYIIYQ